LLVVQYVFDTPIQITFNSLFGFGRRPVAHTCDCTLEVATTHIPTYSDYAEYS